MLILMLLTE